MGGFPNRPDLAAFGPNAIDTRPVRDPSREMAAATWNLLRHQVAGMGVVSPRAFLRFTAGIGPVLLARAEVWNPRGLTSAPFTNPEISRASTGQWVVTYDTPVTDADGVEVPLNFSWGMGVVCTPGSADATFVTVTPRVDEANAMHVTVRQLSEGGTIELVDGHQVAILIG